MKLFLITEGFPYSKPERSFIIPELEVLAKHYDVQIIACTAQSVVTKAIADDDIAQLDERVKTDWIETGFSAGGLKGKLLAAKYMLRALTDKAYKNEVRRMLTDRKNSSSAEKKQAKKDILFFKMCSDRYFDLLKEIIGCDGEKAIIYTFWNNTFTLSAARVKDSNNNIRLVSRIHGYDLYEERTASGIWQPFKTDIDRKTDKLIFLSQKAKDYYLDRYVADREDKSDCSKYRICRMGVSPKASRNMMSNAGELHIVSCSAMIKLKRIDKIISALNLLPDDVNVRWTHFGAGPLETKLAYLADQEIGNKTNISYEFKGFVPNDALLDYYTDTPIDLFITTSETEGVPVSIMEAMSYGIPVIAPDIGGISDQIDGNGILLSAECSIEEVSQAILRIYTAKADDPECIIAMRDRSYDLWCQRFNSQSNTLQLKEIMDDLNR